MVWAVAAARVARVFFILSRLGIQFSHFSFLFFATGVVAVLRGAAGVEESGAHAVELRFLRVVESLVYLPDAGVDDRRFLVWQDDHGAGGE